MKKYIVLCAGLCAAMAFTSCKSSESAYKQAYLKAKAQEEAQQPAQQRVEQNVVTPLEERATTNTRVVDNADNIAVRQENVTVVSGSGLRNFSVVVGSFSLRANADGLQQSLINAGYNAQVVLNNAVQPLCIVWWLPPSTRKLKLLQAATICRQSIPAPGCCMQNKPWRGFFQ